MQISQNFSAPTKAAYSPALYQIKSANIAKLTKRHDVVMSFQRITTKARFGSGVVNQQFSIWAYK